MSRSMSDFGFGPATPDLAWIERLGSDRPADWIVVTGDDRIRRNRHERLAWKRAGLEGFVLARAFQKMPRHQAASLLLWRWPDMSRFIASAAPGSMFELPVGRSSGFVSLSV